FLQHAKVNEVFVGIEGEFAGAIVGERNGAVHGGVGGGGLQRAGGAVGEETGEVDGNNFDRHGRIFAATLAHRLGGEVDVAVVEKPHRVLRNAQRAAV